MKHLLGLHLRIHLSDAYKIKVITKVSKCLYITGTSGRIDCTDVYRCRI